MSKTRWASFVGKKKIKGHMFYRQNVCLALLPKCISTYNIYYNKSCQNLVLVFIYMHIAYWTSLITHLKWGECRSPSEEIGPKPELGLGESSLVEQKQIYYTKNIRLCLVIVFIFCFQFLFFKENFFFLYFQSGKCVWLVEKKK